MAPSTSAARLGYVPALDGLRGVAILGVLGVHLFGLSGGFYGVDLFFVLSGFLITTLLLEEHDRTGRVSLRAFYIRRARRLLPALGAVLVLIAAVGPLYYSPGLVASIVASGLYAANIVRGFGRSDFLGATPAAHLWSLAQEEQFYVLWPVALLSLRRRFTERRLMTLLAAGFVVLVLYRAGLAVAGAGWHRIYYAPDTHMDGLVLGCLLACARRRGLTTVPVLAGCAAAVLAIAAFVFGAQTVPWSLGGLPVVELAAAALVLAALSPGPVGVVLSARPLVWIGALSYSLYLWQIPAMWLTGWDRPWPALALTAVLTLVSYYVIERPFRRPRARTIAVAATAS
ncbi:MAG: acyltransferase family protein [Gaiellaceae bacterium]